ncbi:hypothetical protein E3P80_00519 [Wallemia ichthyophaga]|nr:hypothetical protein E3P85_01845 [Wallemia ichthyophaga]TIB50255.1 hypothetical protein E3P82_00519 [Wallemia ichthyophaga]TIB56485.1 hypothetical protein E3P80_00519 [Wallemia ichthyophaga]TIB61568.1 hypothetical protein E3P79_00520 [Wallemia ichthyophaga]
MVAGPGSPFKVRFGVTHNEAVYRRRRMQSSIYAAETSVTAQSYDYYSECMSTGSNDGRISTHRRNADNGWIEDTEQRLEQAHDGRITSLSYSHPSYGTLLASSSTDRTVKVWEMRQNVPRNQRMISKFTESKTPISALSFCSPSALQLLCISTDGFMRIYQATIPADPTTWSCLHTIHVTSAQMHSTLNSSTPSTPTHTISVCPDKEYSGLVGVVAGCTNAVDIISYSTTNRPGIAHQLDCLTQQPLCSVAWSPGCQRGYWNVAAGARDGLVRIFKLSLSHSDDGSAPVFTSHLVAELEHGGVVASLSWNLFGTVLTSSGDNAKASVWKASYTGLWSCHSTYSISE